jgi:hypothetical protein
MCQCCLLQKEKDVQRFYILLITAVIFLMNYDEIVSPAIACQLIEKTYLFRLFYYYFPLLCFLFVCLFVYIC